MSGLTIQVTWPEYKKLAGEFFRALPLSTPDSADAGFKCLSLAYFGLETKSELEQYQAAIVLKVAATKMIEHGFLDVFDASGQSIQHQER